MRTFVAVSCSGLAGAIEQAQEPLDGPGVDLIDPEQAHVTLQFLGDTDAPDSIENALTSAVETSDVSPFTLRLGGYGVFPDQSYISVIWAGVTAGGSELTALHDAIVAETASLGFDDDDHAFTPHVTLARMRDARHKADIQQVTTERDPDIGERRVDAIQLMQSKLTDEGPVYEALATISL